MGPAMAKLKLDYVDEYRDTPAKCAAISEKAASG
jgi:hypothetical protein